MALPPCLLMIPYSLARNQVCGDPTADPWPDRITQTVVPCVLQPFCIDVRDLAFCFLAHKSLKVRVANPKRVLHDDLAGDQLRGSRLIDSMPVVSGMVARYPPKALQDPNDIEAL